MKRLLITGGSGYLGWHCGIPAKRDWQVFSTYFLKKDGVHETNEPVQLDLTDKDALWKVMKSIKPDAIFHLAADSGTTSCEEHPEESRKLNVESTTAITEMAADLKSKLIFTSSEQVFDGVKGNYSEKDQINPKNEYGKQKLEAEKIIQSIFPESCIVRIAVLFGQATPVANSFLNQWTNSWDLMIPVNAFYDEIRPFLSAEKCAEALFHLLDQGAEGIFHLGGERALSRLEFGEMAKEILGFPNAIIHSKSQQDVDTKSFRPQNLSLDCSKIISTGFKLPSAEEELKRLRPFFEKDTSQMLN